MTTKKKQRGRPAEVEWPEPIDASPEDIARTVLQVPYKKKWRFMENGKKSVAAEGSGVEPQKRV